MSVGDLEKALPTRWVSAEADALISGLMAEPWGQVSASVYETGRLVTLTPWLTGHPQRVRYLVETQRPDGGWGALEPRYALVPTLSATEALLAASRRETLTADAEAAAAGGLRILFRWLHGPEALTASDLPDMPAIELIVPSLVDLINGHLAGSADRLQPPAGLGNTKLTTIRMLLGSGAAVPEKLLHALEVAGDAACRSATIRPASTGTVGASPAATAAWLGGLRPADPDDPAWRYLKSAARQHDGPVACGLPVTVFERAWVLSWLVRAGIRPVVPDALLESLRATLGPAGTAAAAGLPADADTTAGALYALALLGTPHPPDMLRAYELESNFCTWPGEQGHSITTNAHVLEAFGQYICGHPGTAARYLPAITKTSTWLRAQQRADGSWLDRWHVSPYYATACAAIALDRFDGEHSAGAVHRARQWLLATQRPDGSWGVWNGTAEETAYAVQILLLTRPPEEESEHAAARGCAYLQRSPHSPADQPLWHDKDLYLPTAVVRAAVLAARHLGEGARSGDNRTKFPGYVPNDTRSPW
ncbi:MAG TPA: prenyltransferase/squalene oxidase repeat-containing protein [Streptosporangiaceae bacterium]|nr:prenyltransferase/squalene oxidase repeat-containing protein [Streptosporangiaceae bacterium]